MPPVEIQTGVIGRAARRLLAVGGAVTVAVALLAPAGPMARAAGPTGAAVGSVAGEAGQVVGAPPGRRLGTVGVRRCDLEIGRATWCGSVRVPLDPTDPSAATISIGFGWVPSRYRTAATVVAQEGGPGYPSTGTAADFATVFGPLLDHRNLLVVDARGTGRSTPVDCRPLQALPAPAPARAFATAVAACGAQLNRTFRSTRGGFVHASDLFTTANSARDLALVLRRLGLDRVDLYGDSYGTYFAQAFLARYPQLLRSVVLDSAYEARDLDPWYRTTVNTAHRAFDAVCDRAPGCPPGSSWERIGRLTRALRAHPVSGRAPGLDGREVRVRLDVTAVVNLVNDAGYDTEPYRQLDAAARAYLDHRDAEPLLRLYAYDIGWDYSDYVRTPASYYSDGLYLAVACTDYPQLFSMRATRAGREAQLARSIRALPADTFAPFTTREWLHVLPYTETYTGCVDWPGPTHPADPPVPVGAPLDATGVRVLVLNGSLDSLTPAAGGAHIRRQIGPAARTVVAANTVHLVALENDDACGSVIVRYFIAAPRRALARACAARIPPIRAVPRYPLTLADAVPGAGPGSRRTRELASVAVAAAGDAVARVGVLDGSTDLGLRGGRIRWHAATATLSGVRWTVDTTVTGRVVHAGARVRATLSVTGPGGPAETAHLSWGAGRLATVSMTGPSTPPVTVTLPAP